MYFTREVRLAESCPLYLTWTEIVRFEFLTAVKMLMLLLWVVTPCGLVGRYQRPEVLKLETVCFSETLVSTDESARRHNLEEQYRKLKMFNQLAEFHQTR
jgi:hypothetical protein